MPFTARKPTVVWGLLILTALLLVSTLFTTKVQGKMPDFEVYWRAATRALDGTPLYRVEDGHYQLKYLPAFAILVTPLAIVPLIVAKALWFALSLGLLCVLLRLSLHLLPEQRVPSWILVLVTFVVMAKFYAHEMVLGQINILFAALVLLALSQLKAGREGLAGLLLGGSILIKPYGIVFLPYLIARLRRASLVGLGSCLAAGLFLPVISYGLLGTRAELTGWIRTLRETTVPTLTNTGNISVFSLYAKWPVADAAAMILPVITVVGLMVVCLVIFARRRQVAFPEYLEVSLLLTLIPLLSPQGWDYVLLVSTPAVMCLVNYFGDLPRRLRVVVGVSLVTVGFSLFDLMGRTAYYAFMSLSVITLCYFVLVAALYHLRARSLA